jgi:hypothetical protein
VAYNASHALGCWKEQEEKLQEKSSFKQQNHCKQLDPKQW